MKRVDGAPEWAVRFLKRQGYQPRNVMDQHIRAWWSWYQVTNGFYAGDRADTGRGPDPSGRLSIRPARAVCDEWASLVMDEKTSIGSQDRALSEWLSGHAAAFVSEQADNLALAFALGSGCWAVGVDGVGDDGRGAEAVVSVDFYDAGKVVPLTSDGCDSVSVALVSRCLVGGRVLDRVQVHEPVEETGGTYHIRTWLFDPALQGKPVDSGLVVADLDTRSTLPTYAIVRPALSNTYEEFTPLGVSVFDDAVDTIKLVDATFDAMYWRTRLGLPRVICEESGIKVDPKTGVADLGSTIDQKLFKALPGKVGQSSPLTVYDPGTRADESETAMNDALSMLSVKCGFGPNYFSFTRQGGLKTAREVVSDNSVLYRNLRKHEGKVGEALRRLFAGAYAAECGVRTGSAPTGVSVDVTWDDSVVEDADAERETMKDDVARGLCPKWRYVAKYYGMGEDEAREFTGEAKGEPSAAALYGDLGL